MDYKLFAGKEQVWFIFVRLRQAQSLGHTRHSANVCRAFNLGANVFKFWRAELNLPIAWGKNVPYMLEVIPLREQYL